MTTGAQRFITPLTFEALSGRKVRTDAYDLVDPGDTQHIKLTERADAMLVAPATYNIIGKVANGLCDDLVSLMIAAAACPVVFAPSMNHRMWDNPINRRNCTTLVDAGYSFVGPESGWLACRNVGSGRLSEPAQIIDAVTKIIQQATESARSARSAI